MLSGCDVELNHQPKFEGSANFPMDLQKELQSAAEELYLRFGDLQQKLDQHDDVNMESHQSEVVEPVLPPTLGNFFFFNLVTSNVLPILF